MFTTDSMNGNQDTMEYLLIGLLLIFGYFCLYMVFFKKTDNKTKAVPIAAAAILLVVYAVVSVVLIIAFNQYGSLRMTLMMLLVLMSGVGFCILLYCFLTHAHEVKKIPTLLFVLYVGVVAYGTIFSRKEGSQSEILLEFESISKAIKEQSFQPMEHLLMNVALFVPIGFLFVAINPKKLNRISFVIPLGLILTVLIETVQMLLQMGQCDLEDLVANALGAVIGLLCYRVYQNLHL